MTDKTVADRTLSPRSRQNLLDAMKGEAFAYAKYKLFAIHARKAGNLDLAELFDHTADQEFFEHFKEEADLLNLVGNDEQDLNHAIAGESFEVNSMYKDYAKQAAEDGDDAVAVRFDEIRHDEAAHLLAFQDALIRLQTRKRMTRADAKAHDY